MPEKLQQAVTSTATPRGTFHAKILLPFQMEVTNAVTSNAALSLLILAGPSNTEKVKLEMLVEKGKK